MNRGIIRNEQRRYSVWAAAPVVSGRGRLPKVALLPLVVLSPHVRLSHLYPRGVVDDAVHDGVGVGAASDSLAPVLLGVLGGEQGGAGIIDVLRFACGIAGMLYVVRRASVLLLCHIPGWEAGASGRIVGRRALIP